MVIDRRACTAALRWTVAPRTPGPHRGARPSGFWSWFPAR